MLVQYANHSILTSQSATQHTWSAEPSSMRISLRALAATMRSSIESRRCARVGLSTKRTPCAWPLCVSPTAATRTAATGPRVGRPASRSAAEAALMACTSGSHSGSTHNGLHTSCTSAEKPGGNVGRRDLSGGRRTMCKQCQLFIYCDKYTIGK